MISKVKRNSGYFKRKKIYYFDILLVMKKIIIDIKQALKTIYSRIFWRRIILGYAVNFRSLSFIHFSQFAQLVVQVKPPKKNWYPMRNLKYSTNIRFCCASYIFIYLFCLMSKWIGIQWTKFRADARGNHAYCDRQ